METPFPERARKFIVALVGVAVLYGGIAFEVIGDADFSTAEGIIGAVVALLTAYGVYAAPNSPQ